MDYIPSLEVSKTIHETNPDVLSISDEQQISLLSSIIYEYLNRGDDEYYTYDLYEKELWKAQITNSPPEEADENYNLYEIGIWVKSNITQNESNADYACMFTEYFKSIPELLKFVWFEFEHQYTYSKILDNFISNDTFVKDEQCAIIELRLHNKEDIQNYRCCVCLEPNTVLIKQCKHNLCRECCYKLPLAKYCHKQCPLCRETFHIYT